MKFLNNKFIKFAPAENHEINELVSFCRSSFYETYASQCPGLSTLMLKKYTELAFNAEKIELEKSDHPDWIWIARYQENIVGYFKLNDETIPLQSILENLAKHKFLHLERLYIAQSFHSQGLGKQLLQLAKKVATAAEATALWLSVWEGNEKAIRFYNKKDFFKIGSSPWVFEFDGQRYEDDDQVMACILS